MSELSDSFERFRQEAEKLAGRYADRLEELGRKEKELESLRYELRKAREEIERLQGDNEYLRVSCRLAPESDSLVASRRLIAGMIRDIDRCIARLRE